MDSDFWLIQRMKMGDDAAIEVFVRKYYGRILQYCHLHIDDFGYAEDITQETFEKFFRTLQQYQHYGKAMNYLYVIASNACKDYYKKRKEMPIEKIPEQVTEEMGKLEARVDVESAINRLPKELKEVAILFFIQEIKQQEIAKILGIGLPLVKYRVRKSKERITDYLGKGA